MFTLLQFIKAKFCFKKNGSAVHIANNEINPCNNLGLFLLNKRYKS